MEAPLSSGLLCSQVQIETEFMNSSAVRQDTNEPYRGQSEDRAWFGFDDMKVIQAGSDLITQTRIEGRSTC